VGLGLADIAFRSEGKLYLYDHDYNGLVLVPGDGTNGPVMSIYPTAGVGGSQPTVRLWGDLELYEEGYGVDFWTHSGAIWKLYGSSTTDSKEGRLYCGTSGCEFTIDGTNAVITLGSSTADKLTIPATITKDGSGTSYAALRATNVNAAGIGIYTWVDSTDACAVFANTGSGDVIRGFSETNPGSPGFRVTRTCRVICTALQITGGGDLAEPFDVSDPERIEPGMVMAIDADQPGKLRLADTPYDGTVAGVISGANNLNPGVTMQQEGSAADGELPLALTGRVYCWCDASYGPIKPGDLLTTSATPGHAMKLTDRSQADGAILGKAMGRLEQGRGLVLILVALQ
jgi:hypothetical protein